MTKKRPLAGEPLPGAPPGTLVVRSASKPRIFVIDYCESTVDEHEVSSIEEVVPFLEDERPSITWVDVRGIGDHRTFERLGEIFRIHPLALEDLVNVPQRPKTDAYPDQQLIVSRMVRLLDADTVKAEQLGIVFGKTFVLTVQEDEDGDVLGVVRERLRQGRGSIRAAGADHLAYALVDAVIDAFFPVLEAIGERLDELELEVADARRPMSHAIHDVKREMLTVRRAIWPQRDMVSALLRNESPHVGKDTLLYLRDTYDHAVQVMDMVETYREIASGLMDLYLSSVSNRMNEIMKVLTIISTIFLPMTFIAGVYGMNFDTEASPLNMPELRWRYGYLFSLGIMFVSVVLLLLYYRRRGWLQIAPRRRAGRRRL